MGSPIPKLAIGVGNVLRRDDAVGVRLAEILGRLPLPDDVEVVDGGTAGFDTTFLLLDRELVVVADALDAGEEPGAILRLDPDELMPLVRSSLSLHDVHLLDALDEARLIGRAPRRVVVYAVQVGDTSAGIGLTPRIEAALERLVPLVAEELGISARTLGGVRIASTEWTDIKHPGSGP